MRVTPAGTATLSLELDCGEDRERLLLRVVTAGAEVPTLARQLKEGSRIRAQGALRQTTKGLAGSKIEVLADQITLVAR